MTIIEFSDFQRSFCKTFLSNTLPKIKESYVRQGHVRFVYRHFVILGKFSEQAAAAAECAGEQGKFWPYHDRLFDGQGALGFTQSKLEQYGWEIGLNADAFSKCLTTEKHRKKVEGETAVAVSPGVRGTLTFFVNGRSLIGALPYAVFQAVIGHCREEIRREELSGGTK